MSLNPFYYSLVLKDFKEASNLEAYFSTNSPASHYLIEAFRSIPAVDANFPIISSSNVEALNSLHLHGVYPVMSQ